MFILHDTTRARSCMYVTQLLVYVYVYFQLMNALKTGSVTNSRLAKAAELSKDKERISVERSGGGV